jgi:hypothetical protein
MMCRFCGGGDRWIQTVRTFSGEIERCCDPCYLVYRAELVIVPAPVVVWGTCLSCGSLKDPRELMDVKAGAAGRGDAAWRGLRGVRPRSFRRGMTNPR